MEQKKKLLYILGGFILGVLMTTAIWLYIRTHSNLDAGANPEGESIKVALDTPSVKPDDATSAPDESPMPENSPSLPEPPEETTTKLPAEVPDNSNVSTPPEVPSAGQPVEVADSSDIPIPSEMPSAGQPVEAPGSSDAPISSEIPPAGQPVEDPDISDTPISSEMPPTKQPAEASDSSDAPFPSEVPPEKQPAKAPGSSDAPISSEVPPTKQPAEASDNSDKPIPSEISPTKQPAEVPDNPGTLSPSEDSTAETWERASVYIGGDIVRYQGRRYRAKWWTQGELPGSSDVWEDLNIVDGEATQPEGVNNVPVNASIPKDTEQTDFKVVGYYPSWKPDKLSSVDFNIVTHVCYAFAIPMADGSLRDLDNADTAAALIRSAHDNGAKVLLSVGGWSYNDTPLENVFMEATANDAKIQKFADNILAMCEQYGFDGIDMDWEHPRVDGSSAKQYEALMLALSEPLHAKGKLLTAAVLSGATADGNIYYDAAAHTNAVLNAVDFINIMAYDGGDGERHSQYKFAIDCGTYWKETRGLPAHKVVLGVPFYARPSWADYGTILASVPEAYAKDHVAYNGMEVYYNGTDTIAEKTRYALENLGGIMIWELTQDTSDASKSLLQTIGNALK